MTIDVHTHYFPHGYSEEFLKQAKRAVGGKAPPSTTDFSRYWAEADSSTRTIVFGGKAKLSNTWVDDRDIAKFVSSDPRYIGFMSLDPTQPDWQDEMRFAHRNLGLRGIKLLPMYAGFSPVDPAIDPLYAYANEHSLPILFHTGTTFISQAPLKYTLPRLLDEVATRWPDLRMILAHLSHPYEGECIATIRKHPNLFADISALFYRPFQLFHSLMLVTEYAVWDKLLFGTDFPFTTVNGTITGLRNLAEIKMGPFQLPAQEIENMIHRDSLSLLGLE